MPTFLLSPLRAATLALIACATLLAVGCGEPKDTAWRIRFGGDGGTPSAVRVRLRVLSGECSSTAVVYNADVARADTVPLFGEIGQGTYSFEATARDATCTIVARGCVTQALPLAAGDEIVTPLEPLSGELPLCAASACTAGVCAPGSTDAGAPDAR